MRPIEGQRYWIVGASAGIGHAVAHRLAQSGVSVIVSARDGEALEALVGDLPSADRHVAIPTDVTDAGSLRDAYAAAGPIDGVVYCAGAYEPMRASAPSLTDLETMIDVNITGAIRVLAAIVPDFVERRSGHVVLLGSLAGYRGLSDAWGYGASKAALIHLAENMRCDLRGTGIKVQICNPGFVESRLTDKNAFRMPFLMSASRAAELIVRGMASNRFEIAFPWPMVTAFKVMKLLPPTLYFALMGQSRESMNGAR